MRYGRSSIGSSEYQTIAKQDYYEIQTDPGLAADDRERIQNDDPISEETMKQNFRIQRQIGIGKRAIFTEQLVYYPVRTHLVEEG